MTVNFNIEPIISDAEAKIVAAAIKADYFDKEYGDRDAANGALEAYFVTTLRNTPKENLGVRLGELKADFGSFTAFKRATDRVKAFRSKNPAWKTFTA